ncbi:MAG: carboxypeptidase-like regulatory domain-containing protein [Balneolaceae bacterium]|nr:carboxypeptidase-like regulatory domain-containing protein [Balneolaceae bacterium]
MNRFFLITSLFLLVSLVSAEAQNTVSGRVTDAETGEPIVGVNIYLANTTIGTTSRQGGNYVLKTTAKGPFRLVFSFVGYQAKTVQIKIEETGFEPAG